MEIKEINLTSEKTDSIIVFYAKQTALFIQALQEEKKGKEGLYEEIDNFEKENKILKEKVGLYEIQNIATETKLSVEAQQQIDSLIEQVKTADLTIGEQAKELLESVKEITRYKERIANLESELVETHKDHYKNTKIWRSYCDDKDKLREIAVKELKDIQKDYDERLEVIVKKDEEIQQLKAEINQLKAEKTTKAINKEHTVEDYDYLRRANESLRQQVRRLEEYAEKVSANKTEAKEAIKDVCVGMRCGERSCNCNKIAINKIATIIDNI